MRLRVHPDALQQVVDASHRMAARSFIYGVFFGSTFVSAIWVWLR